MVALSDNNDKFYRLVNNDKSNVYFLDMYVGHTRDICELHEIFYDSVEICDGVVCMVRFLLGRFLPVYDFVGNKLTIFPWRWVKSL